MRRIFFFSAAVVLAATGVTVLSLHAQAAQAGPIDGSLSDQVCPVPEFVRIAGQKGIGWSYVPIEPRQKYRELTGLVVDKSKVSETDLPMGHDSHDHNFDLQITRPEDADLLSDVNDDNAIEVEWEIGTTPGERGPGAPERTFPRWAWPSVGDRVWVNGAWIFDCGHGENVNGAIHRETEIHPPRAIATMRNQLAVLPGSGATPVPVTATDLYIHGHAGAVVDDLECTPHLLADDGENTCDFAPEPHRGQPIDEDFHFDIPLPPRPGPRAVLRTATQVVPGNTIGIDPQLRPDPDAGVIHVTVPLAGTGVTPEDVLARRILAGWVYPPTNTRHYRLSLVKMDLHNDQENSTQGDCECTFFWMGLDRAPDVWQRLVDFQIPTDDHAGFFCGRHVNVLNDWDDDRGCGNGELNFAGPTWDFYLPDGQGVNLRANGYDQDCLDGLFGNHDVPAGIAGIAACKVPQNGDNDPYNDLDLPLVPSAMPDGQFTVANPGRQYEATFALQHIPVTGEDTADIQASTTCQPDDGLAVCSTTITNPGPGMPRDVTLNDFLQTDLDPSVYGIDGDPFGFSEDGSSPQPVCSHPDKQFDGTRFSCDLGTIAAGGTVTVNFTVLASQEGDLVNVASLTQHNLDPVPGNNQAFEFVHIPL
jgi:hypothetical protein